MIKKSLFILLAAVVMDVVMIGVHSLYYIFYMLELQRVAGAVLLSVTCLLLLTMIVHAVRWGRRSGYTTADWFFAGCLSWFLLVGYFKVYAGNTTFDIQLHDTMFVIANYHLAFILGILFGWIAIIYYVYPGIFRTKLRSTLGTIHFWMTLAGCFLVLHAGLTNQYGMPRRYIDHENFYTSRPSHMNNFIMFNDLTLFLSWTLVLVLAAQVLFGINLVYSAIKRRKSSN